MEYAFVHRDDETNTTIEISDLMIAEVADSPRHNRYKLTVRVRDGVYYRLYDLYSDYTINEYQIRKRNDKTELERVLGRLKEVLHGCAVPFEWYSKHYYELSMQN